MKWNKNVKPFDMATGILTDESQELPLDSNGQTITLNLMDSSMYERFYKDDVLIAEKKDACEDGDNAIVLLPDDSVLLREFHEEGDQVTLKPVCSEFFEESTFKKSEIKVLAVVRKALRA